MKLFAKLSFAAISLAVVLGVQAQGTAQPSTRQVKSVVVKTVPTSATIQNADGTVTFRFKAPTAKKVQVDVQFAGRNDMQKNGDWWEVTLGPAAPDMYPYCFVVDGVSVMDPNNSAYFPNEGFKNSLLEITSKDGLPHDIRKVPHGKVSYVHYYSKALKGVNNAIVYTPPTYDDKKNQNKKYPVFYLISGTTDTEEVYYKVGRMNYILDNLLAEGKAQEMIIVLPYGNPNKLMPVQPSMGMPQMGFGVDVFSNDLLNDLMPYVEANYRTINDSDHRAIGGFSRGGNQGLANGLGHLDKFSYLCSYSSFTQTNIPGVFDNAEETNKKIHLFWAGVGTDDFLFGNARDFTEFLDQKGVTCVKEYTHDKFGHTWMNAKYFLAHTLPLLFNEKASAEAMSKAQPTLAKTGQEQQFTMGTMARLFPRSVTSPEYREGCVTFRISAPEAQKVLFSSELDQQAKAMERDADGVWSITLSESEYVNGIYAYAFEVDGTMVADASNMYACPDARRVRSLAYSPYSPNFVPTMGEKAYGTVTYQPADGVAVYTPAVEMKKPVVVQLTPGRGDTVESWFKAGCANAIADRLIASGECVPCQITVGDAPYPKSAKVVKIAANEYPNWPARQAALEKALKALK